MLEGCTHQTRAPREKGTRVSGTKGEKNAKKKKTKQKGKVEIGNKHEKTRKINYCVLIIRRFL